MKYGDLMWPDKAMNTVVKEDSIPTENWLGCRTYGESSLLSTTTLLMDLSR